MHGRPTWRYALAILLPLVALALALRFGGARDGAATGRIVRLGTDVVEGPAKGAAESSQVEDVAEQAEAAASEAREPETPATTPRHAADCPDVRTVEETVSATADEYAALRSGVDYEPETLVVSVSSGTTPEALETALEASGIAGMQDVSVTMVTDDVATVSLSEGASVPDCIAELEVSGLVAAAEPNYYLTLSDDVDEPTGESDGLVPADEADATVAADQLVDELAVDGNVADEQPSDQSEPSAEPSDAAIDQSPSDEAQSVGDASEQDALLQTLALSDLINDALALSNDSHVWHLLSVNADKAWEAGARGDRDASGNGPVGIAVMDAGFDLAHEDLADSFVGAYNAVDAGQAGTADNMHADNSHGNHAAGILGAVANNEVGVAGVSYNASVVPVCVSKDGRLVEYADLVRAYAYVIDNADAYNIRVINLSVGAACKSLDGGTGDYEPNGALSDKRKESSRILLGYVDRAYEQGIVSVMASGNRLESTDSSGRTVVTEVPYEAFPSDYGTAVSVIALRNTNAADPKAVTRATYSNYNRVDESGSAFERDKNISAPGSAIYSTNGSGGYDSMSGTSMAAPVVAGTLGLVFSANQGLESADVALTQRDASAADHAKSILYATARDLGDAGWDPYYGYGEVDAAAAVAAATTGVLQGPAYLKTGETATYHVSSELDGWSLSSADAEVLTVGASGAAEAISAGTADVVASASDSVGKTHTALLTVNVFGPMSGASELPVDCTTQLAIAGPAGFSWTWATSNPDVATVAGGLVTGKTPGTATITATLDVDEHVSFSWDVTVTDGAAARTVEVPAGTTFTYDGKAHQGVPEGAHYVVSCAEGQVSEATDAGTYEVTVTPEEGYAWPDGTNDARKVSWKIKPALLTAVYAGGRTAEGAKPKASEAKVTVEGFVAGESAETAAGYVAPTLDFGDAYAAEGSYDVAPSGGSADNYRFAYVAGRLVVTPKAAARVTLSYTYNASEQTVEGVGCTFVASDPGQTIRATDAGSYVATATLNDGYTWEDGATERTRTVTWTIRPASLEHADVYFLEQCRYTGKACRPRVLVVVDGVELEEGVDYTLRYENNVNVGTALVYVDGRGNYTDTATAVFEIMASSNKDTETTDVADAADAGSAMTPRHVVEVDGRTPVKGVDRMLSHDSNAGRPTTPATGDPAQGIGALVLLALLLLLGGALRRRL